MDLEREIQIIALDIQQGKTDFVKGTKRILSLLSVVGQSEQLCEGLHSTDFNGKCFKCGKQVFVREPK